MFCAKSEEYYNYKYLDILISWVSTFFPQKDLKLFKIQKYYR